MSLQQLEALVKMVPTKEEETKLFSYRGDINELGSAEKFVKAMISIPLAFTRVEVMLYRETFEDEVFHLRNSFSMLEVNQKFPLENQINENDARHNLTHLFPNRRLARN